MSGSIKVEAKGDLLIVSEPTSNFVAIYVRPNERPRLTLMQRTPTTGRSWKPGFSQQGNADCGSQMKELWEELPS
jgi:hypothetical protein